jgi:hypothetical protein
VPPRISSAELHTTYIAGHLQQKTGSRVGDNAASWHFGKCRESGAAQA